MTLPPIPFAEIAEAARQRSEDICRRWLPDGHAERHEWVARNPKRVDRNPGSFRINLNTGKWADFATSDFRGGDFIELAVKLFGLSHVDAAKKVAQMVGHPFGDQRR